MMRVARGRRRLLALILATVALAAGSTAAASAFINTTAPLAAGDDTVAKCDTDGFIIDGFTLNGSDQITAIAISGISGACTGGQLSVGLTKSDDVSVGTGGPVSVTGASMNIAISGLPDPTVVKHEVIIIVGP